jgi:hypothetical protein
VMKRSTHKKTPYRDRTFPPSNQPRNQPMPFRANAGPRNSSRRRRRLCGISMRTLEISSTARTYEEPHRRSMNDAQWTSRVNERHPLTRTVRRGRAKDGGRKGK